MLLSLALLAAAYTPPLGGLAARSPPPRAGGVRMAPTLHGTPQSRSPLVNWYCHEAGIELAMAPPRPSKHPFGQVHALPIRSDRHAADAVHPRARALNCLSLIAGALPHR